MTMVGNSINDLSQQIRSGEEVLSALEAIDKMEPLKKSVTEQLIDDLAVALDRESNSYTVLQILKQLRRIARQHPQVAVNAAETVAQFVNEELREFDESDPSENRRIHWGSDVLELVLDGLDPEIDSIAIPFSDIRAFVQFGGPRQRSIGYRLLGHAATGEGVRVLLQDFSHEIAKVTDARDVALEGATALTLSSIDGSGPVGHLDAIDSFTELYRAEVVDPTTSQLTVVQESIFELTDQVTGEDREQLISAVERLSRTDAQTAETIVTDCIDEISSTSADSTPRWKIVRACAVGAPSVVLDHAQTLADHMKQSDEREAMAVLRVVEEAGNNISSVPSVLARPVLRMLESGNTDLVIQAINAIKVMGFYPPPKQLLKLESDQRATLSDAASRATTNIKDRDTVPSFVYDLTSEEASLSLFGDEEGDVHLKRRHAGGQWEDVELGKIREGIIKKVLSLTNHGENVPVVYPYYEPKDIVCLTLALLLSDAGKDREIGLYSPGSQTQWGMKGQIRTEIERFGLSNVSGDVISASPVSEVVTESYVSGGQLKDKREVEDIGRLILTKQLEELQEVDQLDHLVVNAVARAREELEERVSEIEKTHPETELVSAYSCYTRNEREGRPRYGPPLGLKSAQIVPGADLVGQAKDITQSDGRSLAALRQTSDDGTSQSQNNSWQPGEDEIRAWSQPATIRIQHVEAERLTPLFDQLFEESAGLRHSEDAGASGLIFARQMFFERLPIPADDYDKWVRARYAEGDVYVPPMTEERLDDVDRKAGSIDNLEAVQPLNTAKRILERVRERLSQNNPLFNALQERISRAKAKDNQLAIFAESPKNAQLLKETLVDYDILTENDTQISVVSPNNARYMSVCDELIIFGSLHPQHAGYYVHPRAAETVVLTYDTSWATMIENHATEFVDLLNESIGGPDYTPFSPPEVVGDTPSSGTEQDVEAETVAEKSTDSEISDSQSKAELFGEALRSYSASEYGSNSDRYEQERRHYVIETDSGDEIEITNQESVLRKRPTANNDFEWVNVEEINHGDTIVTLPDETERELWKRHLEQRYEGTEGLEAATDTLDLWYETVGEIWKRVKNEVADDSDSNSTGEIIRAIYNWINKEVEDFDRSLSTVRQWFLSVRQAEDPMELTKDPSLIIGPRRYADIEAIGAAFDYDKLETNAREIESVMKGIRNVNRQEGHQYRDLIKQDINSDQETRASKSVTVYGVTEVRQQEERDTENNVEGDTTEEPEDKVRNRAIDLVELAPTKNAELTDKWGYESGSELYSFLSSEFSDYYRRNDNKLIVPTEKARKVASKARKED